MSAKQQEAIAAKCDEIKAMLLKKNEAYGDSVFQTERTFSDIEDPLTLIKVRMDDKLFRIKAARGGFVNNEDPYLDLIGYLILYLVVGDQLEEEAKKSEEPSDTCPGCEKLVEVGKAGVRSTLHKHAFWHNDCHTKMMSEERKKFPL